MGLFRFFAEFFRRNGAVVGLFTLLIVGTWIVLMIVLPQVFMLDFSLRANVPPPKWGGPEHVYTLEHYKYMLYGSAKASGTFNTVDLTVFFRTIGAAVFVTLIDVLLCYPIAYFLAHVARGGFGRLMVVSLIVPFWVNEILRAFAFKIMFGSTGVINAFLLWLGVLDSPYDFIRNDIALFSGLSYAFILLMVFPIYNAVESLDRNQIEAARDLGCIVVEGALARGHSPRQARYKLRLHDGVHAHRGRARRASDPGRPEQPVVHPDHLPGLQPGR